MRDNWFDTAQICRNGHLINSSSVKYPAYNRKHCETCGAPTITTCIECDVPIPGYHHVDGVISTSDIPVPGYCSSCGKPFPWTSEKIKAAEELASELEMLDETEKEQLKQSILDIIKDTPRTSIGVLRFKKIVAKTGGETANAFRAILTDIISETVRKAIWG